MIKIGERAPDFSLEDQAGERVGLSDLNGSWVLLYFYPKDDTPGCTKEALSVKEMWKEFSALGIRVLGISPDSATSHLKFKSRHELPFSLLSDTDKKVIGSYNSWGKKKFMGKEYEGVLRNSFLIDPQGHIVKIYEDVKPSIHAHEVLEDVRALG